LAAADFYRVFKKEGERTPKEYHKAETIPPPATVEAEIQGYLRYDEKNR
jgi:hypothetical protein